MRERDKIHNLKVAVTVEDAGIFSSNRILFISNYTTPSMLFKVRGLQVGFELGSTTVKFCNTVLDSIHPTLSLPASNL